MNSLNVKMAGLAFYTVLVVAISYDSYSLENIYSFYLNYFVNSTFSQLKLMPSIFADSLNPIILFKLSHMMKGVKLSIYVSFANHLLPIVPSIYLTDKLHKLQYLFFFTTYTKFFSMKSFSELFYTPALSFSMLAWATWTYSGSITLTFWPTS